MITMFPSRYFVRQEVRSIRRPQPCRRPLVEALEGRQLLSTFTATKPGSASAQAAVVGNHIGTNAIVGNHIGIEMVVGNHIGTNVSVDAVIANGGVARKH
jgi:hypothetical protein